MELLQQLLKQAGADLDRSFTVVPSFGGYFKSVKRVEEYTPDKVILLLNKRRLIVEGEKLVIDKYFQQDLCIRGDIISVRYE